MEPALLGLGMALLVACLVPLSRGSPLQGAALAYLGAVSWGAAFGGSAGMLVLLGASMTLLFLLVAVGIAIGRRIVARLSARAAT